jgi:hypothetical protein
VFLDTRVHLQGNIQPCRTVGKMYTVEWGLSIKICSCQWMYVSDEGGFFKTKFSFMKIIAHDLMHYITIFLPGRHYFHIEQMSYLQCGVCFHETVWFSSCISSIPYIDHVLQADNEAVTILQLLSSVVHC